MTVLADRVTRVNKNHIFKVTRPLKYVTKAYGSEKIQKIKISVNKIITAALWTLG